MPPYPIQSVLPDIVGPTRAPVDRCGPKPAKLHSLAEYILGSAHELRAGADVAAVRRAAWGGLQDCYDATTAQCGFDPLAERDG